MVLLPNGFFKKSHTKNIPHGFENGFSTWLLVLDEGFWCGFF